MYKDFPANLINLNLNLNSNDNHDLHVHVIRETFQGVLFLRVNFKILALARTMYGYSIQRNVPQLTCMYRAYNVMSKAILHMHALRLYFQFLD